MKMIHPALLCMALGGLAPLVNAAGALEGQLQPAPDSLAELVVSRDENAANACEVGPTCRTNWWRRFPPGRPSA